MDNSIIREIISDEYMKNRFLSALEKAEKVVGDTVGFRGGFNVIEKFGGMPDLTKDGWSCLKELYFDDPVEALALEIVKEATKKTFENVGDNTSSTTILVYSFFKNSLLALKNGKSSIDIQRELEESVNKIVNYIDEISIPVTDKLLYDVARTSANDDHNIAKIVSEAFEKAGEFGIVSHKRSMTDETFIEHVEGNPIESGYTHDSFINVPETQSVIFDNPLVLVSMINFQTANEIIPFLEYASKEAKPLVIISEMSHDIKSLIVTNVQNHNYPFCIVKPPYLGKKGRETMLDLALILECQLLEGISRVNYEGKEELYLGSCQRMEVGKKYSTIIPNSKDNEKVLGKIAELNSQIKHLKKDFEKNYLRERIAKLSGGISTIMVGGVTPSETEERLARVDDAVCAVRSAKEEGVVAGGGTALVSALDLKLDEITRKSISAPYLKILSNAHIDVSIPFWTHLRDALKGRKSKEFYAEQYPMGYNVKTYEVVNLLDSGIVDTAKGVKNSLINAVSASNNLLRTNNCITFKRHN